MDERTYAMVFESQAKSSIMREVWQEAYGDDYPAQADPASFVTSTDLARIEAALRLGADQDLVDLGCGAGGPGAHVARSLGARLTGIDPNPVALDFARLRQLATLVAGSRFERGDFAETGLPDGFAGGVMSTDALLFAPDLAAAFREAARICRPGGVMAFTTFELREPSPSLGGIGPILDYRPHLESAGFSIEVYEETPDWEPRMRAVFSGLLDRRDQITAELGEEVARLTLAWATIRPDELPDSRRVLAVARRS